MTTPSHPADHHGDTWVDDALADAYCEEVEAEYPVQDAPALAVEPNDGAEWDGEANPVAAYADGYQQAVDPGWPAYMGTEAFELGLIDGIDRRLGTAPMADQIEQRLLDWGIELQGG